MNGEHEAPVLCYLSLPPKLENGNYDALGNKVPEDEPHRVRVVLHQLPGLPSPWQVWGVVDQKLDPGQSAQVIFLNVEGTAVPGGAFTRWKRGHAKPALASGTLSLMSVSRAVDRARIVGRNSSDEPMRVAAGLLIVPPLEQAGAGSGLPKRKSSGGSSKKSAAKSKSTKKKGA